MALGTVSSLVVASALLATSAGAQVGTQTAASSATEPTADGAADSGETVTVTGTRIQRPNLTSNSPLTVVDSAEIRYQGAVNIENVLNRLPQVTADANENVSNGSDGTARVNLRNLGSNRNLILINGQRLLPLQANDLNFIPSALVERVDVVTGGASAVYGSDAISGVINFILRDDLNGVRVDTQYGLAIHQNNNAARRALVSGAGYRTPSRTAADGQKLDTNIAFGTNFADGRGNVTAYFGYRHVRPILQANRDVSACALDPNGALSTFVCGGSSNNEFGLFNPLTGPSEGRRLNNTRDGAKTWVPYDSTFRYNYAPLNYFQRSDRRYTAGAFAKYEITPAAEAYGSFMFMDDHTFSQIAPSALFQGTRYSINCDNPLMSAQQRTLLCGSATPTTASQDLFIGYRPVSGNARPRRDDLRHTDYRFTGGVRGEIADGIRYDVNALRSIVLLNESYQNDIDPTQARKALQVVDVNGVPTCKSVVDGTDAGCVPLNVFQYNGISAAAFDYIYRPTFTEGTDKEAVYSATLSADLGKYGLTSPFADDGVGVVLGAEHRRESLKFVADALAQSKGTKNSAGKFDVSEAFGEIDIPLVQDKPFVYALTLNGGYRLSKYSNNDRTISTYKVELAYAPSRDLRLRGSYNRAIRAPNISELFLPQRLNNSTTQDPCAGSTPTATFAQCALTGVTATQYGRIGECPSEQCGIQEGGNPNLRPETADTYTAGVVLTPRFLPRFSMSIDYFNIRVKDYINSIPASLAIDGCFPSGDPFFCNLFKRDSRNGVLFGEQGYIISTTQNTGSLKTAGVDVGVNYAMPATAFGMFDIGFQGTWLDKLVTEPLPGVASYDCKGLFGPTCGQPSPEWKHQMRVSYTEPSQVATVSLNWRYIGSTKLNFTSSNPADYAFNSRIKAYSYFDLAATAKVQDGIVFRAGVNNIADKDPPAIVQGLLALFGNGNTYPGTYDVAGRSVFIGLTAEF